MVDFEHGHEGGGARERDWLLWAVEERVLELQHAVDTGLGQGVIVLGGEKAGSHLHAWCSSKCQEADWRLLRCWDDNKGERGCLWGSLGCRHW